MLLIYNEVPESRQTIDSHSHEPSSLKPRIFLLHPEILYKHKNSTFLFFQEEHT